MVSTSSTTAGSPLSADGFDGLNQRLHSLLHAGFGKLTQQVPVGATLPCGRRPQASPWSQCDNDRPDARL